MQHSCVGEIVNFSIIKIQMRSPRDHIVGLSNQVPPSSFNKVQIPDQTTSK